MSDSNTIRYTFTDEAPALATFSFLPIVENQPDLLFGPRIGRYPHFDSHAHYILQFHAHSSFQ